MPRAALYRGKQGFLALGYLSEHFRIAFQVAVAIGLGMLFIVVNKTFEFLGDASVWIVITVVVAFSNNLGATFQSALLAIVGSVVGAALGILIIALLSGLAMGFSYANHPKTMSAWACILMALVGFLLALNKERFPKMRSAFSFALLTYPIVAIPGFREADENYMERLKLSLCALIGVLLTVLVAVVVFPIRARTMLRKRTAKLLERMGNLAFYLMGEFCEDPDDDMRLKGSSGTDEHQHYVDDGLQHKYEGLHQMRLALNRDLVDMAALIGPATAELGYLRLFRRKTSHYNMGVYRDINRLCGRCLTTLGNLHMYMEGGYMRMGLCVIHKKLIQELRQDIAAAFTCLSGLIINKESDEDARETMENLCSAALEFQATMYSLPIRAEYNIHVETLALFSKISTSVARQAASMYMEMRPEGGARIHKVLCNHMDRTSSKPLSMEEHSPAHSRSNSAEPGESPYGRPSKENAQALSKVLADSDPSSPQEWDIEKGLPGQLAHSPDPLLKLGRLPSISESGSRKGRSSPFSMPSAPAPMYMRAMSFPSHLMIPESVFGSNALLQPAQSAQKPAPKIPPKGSPAEYPVDFPPVSSSESNSDHSSGLSPRASFPQRPSSKQFRDMLRKQMAGQSREPQHTQGRRSDDRLPLGFPFLSPATSSEEPERSSASAPGPGSAGQDGAAQSAHGDALPQDGDSRPKRQVSFRRPPVHRRSGSLPASRSGSVHIQGDMQCGSLSDDDDEDEADDCKNDDRNMTEDCTNVEKYRANNRNNFDAGTVSDYKSASRAGSFNPQESCELCHVPSGIKDGKPSPWMWSRSTSFRSPDNPF